MGANNQSLADRSSYDSITSMIYTPTMDELHLIVKKQRTKNLLKNKICNNCRFRGYGVDRPCPSNETITCCQWSKDERVLFQGGKRSRWKWADGIKAKWEWYTLNDSER